MQKGSDPNTQKVTDPAMRKGLDPAMRDPARRKYAEFGIVSTPFRTLIKVRAVSLKTNIL